jgi:hypothetical protein
MTCFTFLQKDDCFIEQRSRDKVGFIRPFGLIPEGQSRNFV